MIARLFTLAFLATLLLTCQARPTEMEAGGAAGAGDQFAKIMGIDLPIPSGWDLIEYVRNDEEYPAVGREAFLIFEYTRLGGNTGCNTMGGDYTAAGENSLDVPGVMMTKRYCELTANQENAITEVLRGTVTYERLDGNQLLLKNGDVQLKLERNDKRLPDEVTAAPVPKPSKPATMTGLLTYMADAAVFTDCATGQRYGVRFAEAWIDAERAYLDAIDGTAAAPRLLTARMTVTPNVEEEGLPEEVTIVEFLGLKKVGDCPE